jgi:hypothetical protein
MRFLSIWAEDPKAGDKKHIVTCEERSQVICIGMTWERREAGCVNFLPACMKGLRKDIP